MEPTEAAEEERLVQCPVCQRELPGADINPHLDRCLQAGEAQAEPPSKRPRLAAAPPGSQAEGQPEQARPAAGSPVFSLFHKGRGGEQSPAAAGRRSGAGRDEAAGQPGHGCAAALCGESLAQKLEGKPLAERLRPDTLGDYVGQEPVLGAQTLLRSLLESHEIPSLILWGPPGCGKDKEIIKRTEQGTAIPLVAKWKVLVSAASLQEDQTTLAHIIANSSKKNGMRFVTLSATSAKTNDVRDVISQAQNEKRLFKRKTILFIDEIHRFNKSQQDTFLPHVECGTVTLIGATTENPSFQVNAALLSRCRVIVLEKLSVEAMEAILMRAVRFLGLQVLGQGDQHSTPATGSSSKSSE
ncbi:hypothetical protein Nmel_000909 [Mimus melanotis]